MKTTPQDCQYWPFPVSEVDADEPDVAEKVAFLKAAAELGTESYRFGINNYGARSKQRSGIILERGRSRWEIRLSHDGVRCLSAFVECFPIAGEAVKLWLDGCSVSQIIEAIKPQLIVPPGLEKSFTTYEANER